jgi:hypothetical protein
MANKILNYESNGWMAVVTYQNLTSIIGERGQEKGQEMVQKNRKGTGTFFSIYSLIKDMVNYFESLNTKSNYQ